MCFFSCRAARFLRKIVGSLWRWIGTSFQLSSFRLNSVPFSSVQLIHFSSVKFNSVPVTSDQFIKFCSVQLDSVQLHLHKTLHKRIVFTTYVLYLKSSFELQLNQGAELKKWIYFYSSNRFSLSQQIIQSGFVNWINWFIERANSVKICSLLYLMSTEFFMKLCVGLSYWVSKKIFERNKKENIVLLSLASIWCVVYAEVRLFFNVAGGSVSSSQTLVRLSWIAVLAAVVVFVLLHDVWD